MVKIRFGRRSVSMGDDVYNGIYTIELPDEATLGDLMKVVLYGGHEEPDIDLALIERSHFR